MTEFVVNYQDADTNFDATFEDGDQLTVDYYDGIPQSVLDAIPTAITGTANFNLGVSGDSLVVTIANGSITATRIKSASFVPVVSSDHPMLDEYAAEGLSINLENIINNVSFDLRLTAPNASWGVWQYRYLILV